MAIQSLQKIIQLENELYQEEQREQEKLSAWITDQQAEIELYFASKRNDLEKENKQFQEKIKADSKIQASSVLIEAKEIAASLDAIDDEFLINNLSKNLTYISGQGS